MGSPSASSTGQLASGQSQANLQNIHNEGNTSNQVTPYGSVNYQIGPDGKMTAVESYSPVEQSLFNQYAGNIQQQAGNQAGTALTAFGNATGGTGVPDLYGSANSLANQLTGLATSSIEPNLEWQQENLDNQLRNQGIFPGSDAYNRQMQTLYAGQGQAISGFESQFYPQAFNMAQTGSFQDPLQAIQQLSGLGAPMGLAQSNAPTTSSQAPNYANLQQQSYNQQAQNAGGLYGGLGTIASIFGPLALA